MHWAGNIYYDNYATVVFAFSVVVSYGITCMYDPAHDKTYNKTCDQRKLRPLIAGHTGLNVGFVVR